MKILHMREWSFVLVLALSGCAGKLENADDFQTGGPVANAGAPQAGRAPQSQPAGGAGKPASTGQRAGAGGSVRGGAGGNGGRAGDPATSTSTSNDNEDAGVADVSTTQPNETVACDFRTLMQAKCGNATCHGAPGSATGLDLTTAMLAARVDGRQGTGACSDKLLVDTDNPRESKLYLKVSGSTCGSQMPLGGSLNAAEQACVLTWIETL
jgi:hypothetical protein